MKLMHWRWLAGTNEDKLRSMFAGNGNSYSNSLLTLLLYLVKYVCVDVDSSVRGISLVVGRQDRGLVDWLPSFGWLSG